MDLGDIIAIAAAVVSAISVYAAFSSRNEARRSRKISEDALEASKSSAKTAIASVEIAKETRHDAIAPTFEVGSRWLDSHEACVWLEVLQAPTPLRLRVTIEGNSFHIDEKFSGFGAESEVSFIVANGSHSATARSWPWNSRPATHITANVRIRSIPANARWDDPDVVPWETYTFTSWTYVKKGDV